MQVTILCENTVRQSGLLAEHGLAYWIEIEEQTILFDTGQGLALLHNAQQLHTDLATVGTIVLSHGHYDHSGGLDAIRTHAPNAQLFAHPDAFEKKFRKRKDGTYKNVGFPGTIPTNSTPTTTPYHLTDRIHITGPIPLTIPFEEAPHNFFNDTAGSTPDQLLDDQAMWFDTSQGIVVLLGCAHRGVINSLEYIAGITNNAPFHALLGGMHLSAASPERIQKTCLALEHFEFDWLSPGHCTGPKAINAIQNRFPRQFIPLEVGLTLTFPHQ